MTTELDQQKAAQDPQVDEVEQQAGEVSAAPDDADAAFEAGFADVREPTEEAEPPRLFAGYTEDELKPLLEKLKEVDKLKEREAKVFGTLGSLKQSVDALRSQPQQPKATAPVKLDASKFKRLNSEFPEIASMLTEDLSEALQVGSGFDQDAVSRVVRSEIERTGKVYETKLLSVTHPDWRQIAQSQEFQQWTGTLPPDELQVVRDSWDAEAVGKHLSAFKAWQAKATQNKQHRQNRLESGITPTKGIAKTTPVSTEQDAFLAGFRSVRKM